MYWKWTGCAFSVCKASERFAKTGELENHSSDWLSRFHSSCFSINAWIVSQVNSVWQTLSIMPYKVWTSVTLRTGLSLRHWQGPPLMHQMCFSWMEGTVWIHSPPVCWWCTLRIVQWEGNGVISRCSCDIGGSLYVIPLYTPSRVSSYSQTQKRDQLKASLLTFIPREQMWKGQEKKQHGSDWASERINVSEN